MQKIINHLIQLQELTVAKAQKEASMPGSQLTQLDTSIRTLLEDLPSDIRSQFTRLQARDHTAVVPVSKNNVCSACGLSLPVSFVQAIRQAEKIQQCLNCARMLYYSNSLLEGPPIRKAKRGEPQKVGVTRFSSPELMIPQLSGGKCDDVLPEICEIMEEKGFISDGEKLAGEAMKREAIVSTAVDHGLAFPHVRGVEGGGLSLVLGIHKKGIKFGGTSRTLTRIIFFMVIPTAASAFYLKLLAGLTQTFREKEARDKILAEETPEGLWKTLTKVTRSTIR